MFYRRSLPLTVLFILSSAAAHAEPRDVTAADALFQKGRAAMASGDYAGACARFAESHRIDPAPGTLMNISLCEEKQGKLVAAQADLAEAVQKLPRGDFRIPLAEKQLEALKRRVPSVTIALDEPSAGARVACDGTELAREALGRPLPLDPGSHLVEVQADGRTGTRRLLVLAEGEQAAIAVGAGPEAAPAPSAPVGAAQNVVADPGAARRTLALGALAVGGAAVVTGIVTGLVTASAASTYAERCPGRVCDAEGADAASRGRTMEVVSPVAFVVGVLGAGAGAYLLLTPKRATTTAHVRVTPSLSAREAGLGLGGTF